MVKVGGKIVEEVDTLKQLLEDFAQIEGHKVLVHGGGRSATKVAAELGIESQMVDGRRITDAGMLKVVTMVYGGLVNKNIVAGLQALGVNALGLTGADMNLMRSEKRPVKEVDYGFVGDVKEVNAGLLADLIRRVQEYWFSPIFRYMRFLLILWAGVPGGDSRCSSTGPTCRCSRRRTAHNPGPGYSYRHGAGTGHYR